MTWNVVAASEIGTSHTAVGGKCEDSCWASVEVAASGAPVLAMFVSDGAGSAAKGGDGAELAIQTAASFVADRMRAGELELQPSFAVDCVRAVRDRIHEQAEQQGLVPRDFACTLLGLVSSQTATVVFQIGDGGVVLDMGDGLTLAVEPMAGEYANMTHFVTDEDAINLLVTQPYAKPALRAALFSDGIQRLALNMANNTVHEPFFQRFFKVLSLTGPEQEDELHAALVRFLGGADVNERTDDDKTLALAVYKA